ncbi:MAG: radical SAM family heme chaperone HemW [bacterium]|nr:radical SAM family heme chaperone HemW [bacterium]
MDQENSSLSSIYIHIPFCIRKCPYCDFNSYTVSSNGRVDGRIEMPEDSYTKALLLEMSSYAEDELWKEKIVKTIYLGGGTPSLFSDISLKVILEHLRRSFHVPEGVEITIEANPGTIGEQLTEAKLYSLRTAGFNRLSLGAQSWSASKLQSLGRIHNPGDTEKTVAAARAAGFENISLDLMYAISDEDESALLLDLQSAVNLKPQHISAYILSIEPGTDFFRRKQRGETITADEEKAAAMNQLTRKYLRENGYRQYEISNFALPGHESKHNQAYWSGRSYIGLGAGAHGFAQLDEGAEPPKVKAWRWKNAPGPDDYIKRVQSYGRSEISREELTDEQRKLEFFLLGLRQSNGVNLKDFEIRFKSSLPKSFFSSVQYLSDKGMLVFSGSQLALSEAGMIYSDSIIDTLTDNLG